MATNTNQDFLRFSAYSIKDLITRKLTENSKFTDQVYEGSNLAILIDIFSYIAQGLLYSLNNAASESMFADTQVYENIVRLTKFIGYNPKGATASTMNVYVNNISQQSIRSYWIPPYSRIDTGLTDAVGKKIYFSTSCNDLKRGSPITLTDSNQIPITLYNGIWKMYGTVFTASGIENETFLLEGLKSDSDQNKYVAHDFIDVYVQHFDQTMNPPQWTFGKDSWTMDKNGIFTGYSSSSESSKKLFNNQTAFKSLYPGTYQIYTVQLNENKTYELKFGNGVVGKKLSYGDKVYVFYLDTNGPDGKVDLTTFDISKLKFQHSADMFGISYDLYNQIFKLNDSDHIYDLEMNLTNESNKNKYMLSFANQTTTTPQLEETVEEIRENAPLWFTTGNRLVTRFDYEYYLKNARNTNSIVGCDIIDVKCMNNWEYIATFYKWLYNMGHSGNFVNFDKYGNRLNVHPQNLYWDKVGRHPESRYYLSKNKFVKNDYFYADAADANNLYIWLKAVNDEFDTADVTVNLNELLEPIKLMTAELVACKSINVNFDICASDINYALENYINDDFDSDHKFDENCDSYIEVTLDDNTMYVANSLQKEIYNIIIDGFNVNKCKLGQAVQFDKILNSIYEINGVYKVRTIFKPNGETIPRIYDGLSFASWSNAKDFIKCGEDLNVSNTIRQLEEFQFPVFVGQTTLMNRIKIIKKSLSTINTIKF